MKLRRSRFPDDGFTLVELMIYAVLSVVVLGIVGGLVVAGVRAQTGIGFSTTAANTAQSASDRLSADVRRATYIRIASVGDDIMMTMRVKPDVESATVGCVAYYWSKSRKEIRATQSTTAIPSPTTAALTGWSLVSSSASQSGTTAVFLGDGTSNTKLVDVSFSVAAQGRPSVVVASRMIPRYTGSEVSAPCF